MKIKEILKILNYKSYKIPENMRETRIISLCHNSRHADPFCLFFCRKGAVVDGHIYAKNAYTNGARFFVAERELDLPNDAAVIIVEDATDELRKLSIIFYGNPSQKLRIIGITGTKGKTTVALSIYNILRAGGISAGYIGTNGLYYNDYIFETTNTTPDCLDLQKSFREMVNNGVTTVVLEISSQALWQQRTYGLEFDTCVFTNLYEDHIGGYEHPTMEHYKSCKKMLFTDYKTDCIILNSDSPDADYMIDGAQCSNVITTSACGNNNCDFYADKVMKFMRGMLPGVSFELNSKSGENSNDVFIPIPGHYSVENGLLCIAACLRYGLKLDFIIEQMASLCIKGRFEPVLLETRPKSLFVIDYAHNGASLSAVLNALREYEPNRIICLFGSVGGRTFGRRAELANAAKAGADVIIVTSDNPDCEEPVDVVEDIGRYLKDAKVPVYLIADRKEAIEKAYKLSQDGDFILLAGKGHEAYQLIGGERVPFSERKILMRADSLSRLYGGGSYV